MERVLGSLAVGLAVINTVALVWLWQQPMPPDHIPAVADVTDPFEGVLEEKNQLAPTDESMALLDAILAQRLTEEATKRGVVAVLPPDELRAEVAGAASDSEAAIRLLAAYEHSFAELGLSLDGLGR